MLPSLLIFAAVAATQPAGGAGLSPEARFAIAARCDALIARAVKTPFGIGWIETTDAAEASNKRRLPWISTSVTAQTGLVLLEAGQALHEPRYENAAFDAGRGLVSVQIQSGQFRGRAVMGAPRTTLDPPVDVPERGPTRLAIAFMLTMVDVDRPAPDQSAATDRHWAERLRGPAMHGASWLAGQQAAVGLWISAYPPDAPLKTANRLIRLDEPDLRDDLSALLLAGDVLDNESLRRSAGRVVEGLLRLRVVDARTNSRFLWASAYLPEGAVATRFRELDRGVDVLACRYATQAIMADYLLTLDTVANDGLVEAARQIRSLPRSDGQLGRFYDLRGQVIVGATTEPAGPTPGLMDQTLAVVTQVDAVGGKKYSDFIAAAEPIRLRLAEQASGLWDDAMGLGLESDPKPPVARSGVYADAAYIWNLLEKSRSKTRP